MFDPQPSVKPSFPELYGRPDIAHEFVRERGPNPLVEWVLARGTGLRVLELGCGLGNDAEALLRSGRVAAYCGVDVSGRALQRHRHRCRRLVADTEYDLLKGDVRDVLAAPWQHPPVDVVYAYSSLHYFAADDISTVLRAARAVAARDAMLFLALKGPGSAWDGVGEKVGTSRWRHADGVVRWFPTGDAVVALVAQSGWHVVRRDTHEHWGYSELGRCDVFTHLAASPADDASPPTRA